MNHRSILFVLALCLSVASPLANAVTCSPDLVRNSTNPDSAYSDNGDGTVTHTPTGLIWKRCAEGMTWRGGTCTGVETNVQNLPTGPFSFAGKTDWRVPNIKELRSLVEECRIAPAINDTIFPNAPSSVFISSSTTVVTRSLYWRVDFQDGNNEFQGVSGSLRLVRGGQSSVPVAALSDTECFLDWAEARLPSILRPAKQRTQTYGTLQYRAYPDSEVYFGLDGTTVLAIGGQVGTSLRNLGDLSTYLPSARAAQCR